MKRAVVIIGLLIALAASGWAQSLCRVSATFSGLRGPDKQATLTVFRVLLNGATYSNKPVVFRVDSNGVLLGADNAPGVQLPQGAVVWLYANASAVPLVGLDANPNSGTPYQVPSKASATIYELQGATTVLRAQGDLIVGGVDGLPTRLPAGANGKCLVMVSGIPAWATCPGGGGGGSSTWGGIIGTLSDQTDLQAALNLKANIASLATIATTGAYSDLTGKPSLGTAAALNVAASGNAASGEVVKGNDTRLTDARTPSAHTHPFTDITSTPTTLAGYGITNGVPTTRTVNGHALSSNVTVTPIDLGLVIGTDVQAWSANLDVWATKAAPTGNVVGTSDAQTLSNKTFVAPILGAASGTSLAIGTVSPLTVFHVAESSVSTPRGITNSQHSDTTNSARLNLYKSGGTNASPTTVLTGYVLGNIVFGGYDGSNYLDMGAIRSVVVGTVAGTRVPTKMEFYTGTDTVPSVNTLALTLAADQNATFAAGVTASAFSGSGANLTALNASSLGSGTVPDARFPATLPTASGVNLTALNASNLGSGTVPLERLSGITNTEISGSAAIAYSKLNLSGSIVNADIGASAAIAYGKLNLTGAILNGDLAGSIANAKLLNSAITIAGTSTSLGGSITLDTITGLSSTGLVKRSAANTFVIATSGGDYEVPVSAGTGLTRTTNTFSVNTSQNIATLSNLTSNGFVKTLGGTGALSVDTTSYTPTSTTVAGNALSGNISATALTASLNAFVGDSGSGGTKGLVPVPATGDSTKYLKGDGTWATVSASVDQSATYTWTGPHTWSGNAQTIKRDSLGTSNATGLELTNTTAAGAGAQQISPDLLFTAQGWKTTATAASQTVQFRQYVLPVQGAANPTANWKLQSQINGGGYTDQLVATSAGKVQFPSGSSSATGWEFIGSAGTGMSTNGSGVFFWNSSTIQLALNMNLSVGSSSGYGFASGAAGATLNDTLISKPATRVIRISDGPTVTTGATLSTPGITPVQITSDQNNYSPGTGWFIRLSSDASRNLTGLNAGQDGQIAEIWNVGSFNIVIQDESSTTASTAANRFLTSTAADLTVAPRKCAELRYDGTSSRWRVRLCNGPDLWGWLFLLWLLPEIVNRARRHSKEIA